jgi:hypothetical protein
MKDTVVGPDSSPDTRTARSKSRPQSGEAPFAIDEIFYSRTDPRGVIQSGNDVFQRVADYPWDRLVGAPHKVIRHPDMPSAVFWLLWQTIQQDRPIGAYVKNRASDGLHYWVFAAVTPIEGGYLSIRIKPSSKLFATVQEELATLREAELSEGLTPADSAGRLLERLKALGFDDYGAFMSHALAEELTARDAAMGLVADPLLAAIRKIEESLGQIHGEITTLFDSFITIRLMPTNMRIAASRLEPAGGPITAISENYRLMATEVASQLEAFREGGQPIAGIWLALVREAVFLHCVARLQENCVGQIDNIGPDSASLSQTGDDDEEEPTSQTSDVVSETGLLITQMIDYREKAHHALERVIAAVGQLPALCAALRQQMVGLDAVRRSCRVENSWVCARGGGLTAIIEQLDSFHIETEGRLELITDQAQQITAQLRAISRRGQPTPGALAAERLRRASKEAPPAQRL